VLTTVLVAAAVAAGLTGAWSPCGFSMVDTLAPHGYAGRLVTTLTGCVTFAAGALAGGAITFGGLALLGHALGAAGTTVAAVVALAAAVGEARGARIVPQVRRQVPESWRRVLPLPLAAGLYGVLLGLGFTTFILTFAVWALAAVSIALGEPHLGLLVGLGFGLGRLAPVVVLAPAAGTDWGTSAHAAMAERPAILRGLRAVDAAALAACALALATAPAQAATRAHVVARNASDPSVAPGGVVAWQGPGGVGWLHSGDSTWPAPGTHPAVAEGRLAWIAGGAVHVQGAAPDEVVIPAPGADALAVGPAWVAWRAREGSVDVLHTAQLPSAAPGPSVSAPPGRALGRPALDGSRMLFHVTTARGAEIQAIDLTTGAQVTLRRQHRVLLLNPSGLNGRLVYVRSTSRSQQVRYGTAVPRRVGRDRLLWSALETGRPDAGCEPRHCHAPDHPHHAPPRPPRGRNDTLWTTALSPTAAYVTRLRQLTGRPVTGTLLRVSL
jgi:hypothetical protein